MLLDHIGWTENNRVEFSREIISWGELEFISVFEFCGKINEELEMLVKAK